MLHRDVAANDILFDFIQKVHEKRRQDTWLQNVMISCESIQLRVTKSGDCAIPICWHSTILCNVTTWVKKP